MNYKATFKEKAFNMELIDYLREVPVETHIFKHFLNINDIYAKRFGHYAETDEEWIDVTCYDILKMLSDRFGAVVDLEDESQKNMFDWLAMAELKAGLEGRNIENLIKDMNK